MKTLKGSVGFEIEIKEDGYTINFDQTFNGELAALMITREIAKYSKQTLTESLKQAKGKDRAMVKDRLRRITNMEYMLGYMIVPLCAEVFNAEEPVTEPVVEPIVDTPKTEENEVTT